MGLWIGKMLRLEDIPGIEPDEVEKIRFDLDQNTVELIGEKSRLF